MPEPEVNPDKNRFNADPESVSFDTTDPDDPAEPGEGDDDTDSKSLSERLANGEVVDWL